MSAYRTSSDSQVRHPDHDDVEAMLGPWPTIAGETPTATELKRAASRILEDNSDATVSKELAKQSLRYVWRRQKLPHGREWKTAEGACQRVLEAVQ